ncbi:MAG: hypothetical protein KAQ73_02370, partial [Dehalococcoidia bacterium]|nr:hypothetical protein [Dehalococcoidia bacterium]
NEHSNQHGKQYDRTHSAGAPAAFPWQSGRRGGAGQAAGGEARHQRGADRHSTPSAVSGNDPERAPRIGFPAALRARYYRVMDTEARFPAHRPGGGGGGQVRTPRNEPQEPHAWPSRPREAKGLDRGDAEVGGLMDLGLPAQEGVGHGIDDVPYI